MKTDRWCLFACLLLIVGVSAYDSFRCATDSEVLAEIELNPDEAPGVDEIRAQIAIGSVGQIRDIGGEVFQRPHRVAAKQSDWIDIDSAEAAGTDEPGQRAVGWPGEIRRVVVRGHPKQAATGVACGRGGRGRRAVDHVKQDPGRVACRHVQDIMDDLRRIGRALGGSGGGGDVGGAPRALRLGSARRLLQQQLQ